MTMKARNIAILYPGDVDVRRDAALESSRFASLHEAFTKAGVNVEPAVYHDDFREEVRQQLLRLDGVLVWVNPIEKGRDRALLDSMLRDVAAAGVFVSAHPEVILKLGTKEVLYSTRSLGWGCETYLYTSMEQFRQDLAARLVNGETRVVKQYRGSSGDGVWKVRLEGGTKPPKLPEVCADYPEDVLVVARHAKRGGNDEQMTLKDFFNICEPYLIDGGKLIDQPYQERLPEGMIRCYLVQGRVAGFGHQAINALVPAPPGVPSSEAPIPSARHYHPPTKREFQMLKKKVEQEWVPDAQKVLGISTDELPILWDCDFLLGPKSADGADTYVLCEINVSSVAPFPESAVQHVLDSTIRMIERRLDPPLAGGVS